MKETVDPVATAEVSELIDCLSQMSRAEIRERLQVISGRAELIAYDAAATEEIRVNARRVYHAVWELCELFGFRKHDLAMAKAVFETRLQLERNGHLGARR
jgi:hypothetical protein